MAYKRILYLQIFFTYITIKLFSAESLDTKSNSDDFIKMISYLKNTLSKQEISFKDKKNLTRLQNKKKLSKDEEILLEKLRKRELRNSFIDGAFSLIEKTDFYKNHKESGYIWDVNVLKDLRLTADNNISSGNENNLLSKINMTTTSLGEVATACNFICHKEDNTEEKIKILNELIYKDIDVFEEDFETLKKNEDLFINLFRNDLPSDRYNIFKNNRYLDFLNNFLISEKKISSGEWFYIISQHIDGIFCNSLAISLVIYTAIFCKKYLRFILPTLFCILEIGMLFFYAKILLQEPYNPKGFYKKLSENFKSIKNYISTVKNIYKKIRNNEELWNIYGHKLRHCEELFENKKELTKEQTTMLNLLNIIPENWSYWGQWGKARAKIFCKFFILFDRNKDIFSDAIFEIAQFESYIGRIRLLKDEKLKNKFCIANILDTKQTISTLSPSPKIESEGAWNPCLPVDVAVSNKILFDEKTLFMILYGMNAGGKTTMLETIAYQIFIGMSLGICPAKKSVFSKFSKLYTMINITTDINKGFSKAMAEVYYADICKNILEELDYKEFGLFIIDEMFTGARPEDAGRATYNFIEKISENEKKNIIGAISSQNILITTLEKNFKNRGIKNFTMEVKTYENDIEYHYKLLEGLQKRSIFKTLIKKMKKLGLIKECDYLIKNLE